MQKAVNYHRALQEALKRQEGEGELDLAPKGDNAFTQLQTQMDNFF